MLSFLYTLVTVVSLFPPCHSAYCDSSLLSLTQMVPLSISSLHKPPSLFNMTLPLDSLTVTGMSLSCRTAAGCGTLSALFLSHTDKQVSLHPSLIRFYLSSNWAYDAQFKLYLGPVSTKSLTLSLEFSLSPDSGPLLISSSLYGCEARLQQVQTRQLLQYDLAPAPPLPDPEYTGLVHGGVVSGGVGKLTDGDVRTRVEWNSSTAQTLHFLFRFDRAYNLTELELVSLLPFPINQVSVTARQDSCNVTTNSIGLIAVSLHQCGYLFLSLEIPAGPFLLSEVRIRTETGLLTGKNSPNLNLATPSTPSLFNVATLAAVLVTFFLTSLLCLLVLAASCLCLRRRTGISRWISRTRRYKRRADYMTMKTSDKSCTDPSQPEMDTDHNYATLNPPGELEASSVYVDMSTAAKNQPIPPPSRTASPPPPASSFYMSMRIRDGPEASPGGFFSRIREKLSQMRSSLPLSPGHGPGTQLEAASDGAGFQQTEKASTTITRRGGIKMKSNPGIVSSPTCPPPRPPSDQSGGREKTSEGLKQAGENMESGLSRKGAIKLKESI